MLKTAFVTFIHLNIPNLVIFKMIQHDNPVKAKYKQGWVFCKQHKLIGEKKLGPKTPHDGSVSWFGFLNIPALIKKSFNIYVL